tara:strand:+ start:945 stop:1277 length:333 start_codon:yes stop_codon:yes gene_type:complete
MNKNNLILLAFLSLLLLNACQAAKDGLTGKTKDNTDEFLVQKKNPLVLPPDYNDLPVPKKLEKKKEQSLQDTDNEIKKLIESNTGEESSSESSSADQSLENSILKTLNED